MTTKTITHRDLYVGVSARIIAELEKGAAPWIKPWSATAGRNVPCNAATNRPYSGCNVILLWIAGNRGWATPRFLTFKQAVELGGHVRKGETGTRVYFVKQLVGKDKDDDEKTRVIPMMREYTVFNVDQCEGLPARVTAGGTVKVRNPDERDATIDEFLSCSGADIREGHGEACFVPSKDFISMRPLPRSRARRTFTPRRSMNSPTGPGTNRGLIVSKPWPPGSAMRLMQARNW
jgi:antirestriction protein ArdC